MKSRKLLHIFLVLNLLPAFLPLSALSMAVVPTGESTDLLQFTAGGHVLGFSPEGMYAATGSHALHVLFVDARSVQPQSEGSTAEGQAASLDRVTYAGLWDGIDLAFDAEAGGIYTTTYTIAPGANPTLIRLQYNAPIMLNEDGTLSIAFETGTMTESAPVAWQEIDGERIPVEVAFQVDGQEAGFALGAYDSHFALTIDPSLAWHTFLGGSGADNGTSIAVDGMGNIYVAGYSDFSWGSPVRYFTADSDAFVAKFDSAGGLIWNTFLGGSGEDSGRAVAVDGSGNVYVGGRSNAMWGSPVRSYTAGIDTFAAKIDSAGNLTWNTFLGGSGVDHGRSIAVDGSGNVYVGGDSDAAWGSPVQAFAGGSDAFAVKLAASGALTWSTFLGGSEWDDGYGIAVDGSGNVYVAGASSASWGSPVRAHSGSGDAYAAKLDSTGSLTWNTFLGGDGIDRGFGITVDGSGNVYVAGESDATWGSPIRAYTGCNDAFAAKLDSAGGLTWNTFLGGSGEDSTYGAEIAVDGSGNVYVTGLSYSGWGSPVRAYTAAVDSFAVKLDSAGNLTWNTFLGGSGDDYSMGIAEYSGDVYVAGTSHAEWGSPVRAYTGLNDGFAARLSCAGSLTWHTFLGQGGSNSGLGIAVDGSGNVYVAGYSAPGWGSPVRAYASAYDAFAAKLDSAGNLIWHTFLGGSEDDFGEAIAVDGSGNVYVAGASYASWGSPVRVYTANKDTFAAMLDPAGNLIWNTFLGGGGFDHGTGIALDGSDNVYVGGISSAAWGTPVRAYTANDDAFAAKLDPAGTLTWHTFLGGGGYDHGLGIAVDGSGDVYLAGDSNDSWGSPVRAFSSGNDAFAAKLTAAGGLTWNTFLGGSGNDFGTAVVVEGSGNVYVAGESDATWGSPLRIYTADHDGFAAKMDTEGNLMWNTFLGGSGEDKAQGITLDGSGYIFLAGYSTASWASPTLPYNGGYDAFAVKLFTNGGLVWNTFLGGSSGDGGYAIAADGSGSAFMAGFTMSTWGSPVRAYTGGVDAFAARLDSVPPGAFGKSAPADEDYVTTAPTLSWGTSSGAASYEYCYDTIDNDACDDSWISTGMSQSAVLSGLTANTIYYWQARAVNLDGITEADNGTWRTFTALPVSFGDVLSSHWAWSWIERLFAAGITSGCGGGNYCPNNPVTRAEMAIFLERGIHGSSYTPPAATGTVFGDVPISHWAADWIEQLSADGITSGCGGGNYCPNDPVTRAEMAIFLLRSKHGSSYTPPAATGTVFGDVPISHWAAAWIEQLAAEGITSGCGGGNYCPNSPVTRAEMAVFLVRTFELP